MGGVVKSIRHLLCALTLLTIPSTASAATGHELLRQCEALVRGAVIRRDQVTLPRGRSAAECWFYMAAVQDLTATVEVEGGPSVLGACLPPETTRMDIIWAFVRYARTHRNQLAERVTAILIPALVKKFPCEKP